MLINVNIVPSQIIVTVLYVKHMVIAILVQRVNMLVLKLYVHLCVLLAVINLLLFFPMYKSLHAINISISKTVCFSISFKPISALISSEPVKYFVTCKPVCFSNVSTANEFNFSLLLLTLTL